METATPPSRKPYAAPTLVRHGGAVQKTRGGSFGLYIEYEGWYRG